MTPAVIEALPPSLIVGSALILGLLVGSFLNVVALRLPARLQWSWRSQCRELLEQSCETEAEEPPDLVRVPSHCPACGHRIRWFENIPVISWLVLRGKCSACSARISLQYPMLELATGLLTALIAVEFGATFQGLLIMVFTWTLIALTAIDIREQLLPDSLTLPLLWLGLLLNATEYGITDPQSAVIGAAAGYLSLWLVFHGFKALTGKEGMGYGDFKLLAALGAWLGWQMLPLIVVLSSFVGAAFGIAVIIIRGRNRNVPMPFGPYLAVAGFLALLRGPELVSVYLDASGLS